ncbi:MAG: serine/threonine protein kinase [Polyangiaceae bacterium]|nr:serine/threonine protein kinase [Polyangiaceae bacterium]
MALSGVPPANRLGPYELGERLGNGGMAEVYVGRRAGPHGFQKRFAIKRILPQLAVDSRFVEMFCDEARICAALTHPNIVQVVDFGEHDGELFMAMEFVDGVSLARLLRAVAARSNRFPLGAALAITSEVLRGLRFAHEARDERGRPLNIVHRDVSPGNILIGRGGEVKLTDFGIVLSAFVDRRTYPGELKGKMGYMSPEQVIGEELDARSDLFTLGIVLAEMLLARPLFPGKNELDMLTRMYEADLRVLDRYGGDLPPPLTAVLRTVLARDRDRRFQTARDFGDALRGLASELGLALHEAQLGAWLGELDILPPVADPRLGGAQSASPPPRGVPRGGVAPPPAPGVAEARPLGHPEPFRRHPTPPRVPVAVRRSEYYLQGAGGAVSGPMSLPDLLLEIATGTVGSSALVAESGTSFLPIGRVPALAALAERPAFRFGERREGAATWRRRLDRRTLPGILLASARTAATGLLVAHDGSRQKRVYLEGGVPHFVASTDRSEVFGAWLVRAGLLEAGQIEPALLLAADRGQRLGEMLVAIGQLRPTALLRALVEQVESRYFELATWGTGELVFSRGEQSVEDRVNVIGSAIGLAAAAIHRGYVDAEIALLLAPLQAEPIARLRTDVDPGALGLSAAQRRALELAPGAPSLRRLLAELARDAAVRPEDSLRGVFMGLAAGLLIMPGWPMSPP